MKSSMHLKVATLAAATLGVLGGVGSAIAYTPQSHAQLTSSSLVAQTQTTPVQPTPTQPTSTQPTQVQPNQTTGAQQFGEQPLLDPSRLLLVAAPGSALSPNQFFIIEQQSNARPCWNETTPGAIDPLWTTFDFTGICGRYGDSNAYSIRTAGVEQGLNYQFKLEERDGNLVLYGIPKPTNPDKRRLLIGRTNGKSSTGFTRINLEPGWSLAKRTYEGRTLGHIYTTTTTTLAQLLDASGQVATGGGTTPTPPVVRPPVVTPPVVTPPVATTPFTDTQGDLYAAQIARASELKLIAGFEDNTFRPRNTVTREQAVSIVMEAVRQKVPASVLANLPQQVYSASFPDVATNRWSALKIAQAKQLGIVTGDYETGNFRPADNVTRAELIAMLRKAILVQRAGIVSPTGTPSTTLVPTQTAVNFSDTAGHWAAGTISELSAYCGIASPLNENGTNFAPNEQALRNYASAAVVRWVDCQARQQGS